MPFLRRISQSIVHLLATRFVIYYNSEIEIEGGEGGI